MAKKTNQAGIDPQRRIRNLLTYWRFFRSKELPKRPHGIEVIITDTIEVLEQYLDTLSTQ